MELRTRRDLGTCLGHPEKSLGSPWQCFVWMTWCGQSRPAPLAGSPSITIVHFSSFARFTGPVENDHFG